MKIMKPLWHANRRNFLKQSAAAIGSFAVVACAPSTRVKRGRLYLLSAKPTKEANMLGRLIRVILCGLLACGLYTQAQAAEFSITVPVDDITQVDLSLLEAWMVDAVDGAEVPRTLRRVMMAGVGEVGRLTRPRLGADGTLTLDDGVLVPLLSDDTIIVTPQGAAIGGKVTIRFILLVPPQPRRFIAVPCRIEIQNLEFGLTCVRLRECDQQQVVCTKCVGP